MTGTVIDPPRQQPGIDARIRARRIEVRRREGRRRLRRIVVLAAITVVVAAAWALTRSSLLDVDRIVVTGPSHTDAADLVTAAGVARGDALVDLDTGAAARRVAALPWIASAEVSRAWGGTVTISVIERRPLAVLRGADGAGWLVDPDGVVIDDAAAADPLPPLPVVEGVAPVAPGQVLDPVPARLLQLVAATPDDVWAQVEAVEVDADGQTWMRLRARPGELDADGVPRTDGGRIRLGDLRAVDDQVVAVATLLGQVDLTDLDVADLRVPDSFVVTRTGPVDDAPSPDGADTDGGER